MNDEGKFSEPGFFENDERKKFYVMSYQLKMDLVKWANLPCENEFEKTVSNSMYKKCCLAMVKLHVDGKGKVLRMKSISEQTDLWRLEILQMEKDIVEIKIVIDNRRDTLKTVEDLVEQLEKYKIYDELPINNSRKCAQQALKSLKNEKEALNYHLADLDQEEEMMFNMFLNCGIILKLSGDHRSFTRVTSEETPRG